VADRIFKEAIMAQSIDTTTLLMAISPFTGKAVNDLVIRKAIDENINAIILVEKALPFASTSTVSHIVDYCISCEYPPEALLHVATLPHTRHMVVNRIINYAIDKKIKPKFLNSELQSFLNGAALQMVVEYLEFVGNEGAVDILPSTDMIRTLKKIFN